MTINETEILQKLRELESKVNRLEIKLNVFIKVLGPSVSLDQDSIEGMPLILKCKKQQIVGTEKEI